LPPSYGAVGIFVGTQLFPTGAPAEPGPGVVYETPVPLPDFTLTDQTGAPYTFSSSRGKVVLMAFLFTHCGDVCPFGAVKMRVALDQLGDLAKNVELVVVSTDPERDTVPVIADYSKDLGLYDKWHMVTGPLDTMTNLYKGLKITVIKDDEDESKAPGATDLSVSLPQKDKVDSPLYGLSDDQVLAGDKVAKKFAGGYNIAHSAPFWVVDTEGNLRTSLDVSATPAQLVAAIKSYLKG
jgi:cytochrome oxidase Cu insertion factor (SCO1/SenC/PrrC family)